MLRKAFGASALSIATLIASPAIATVVQFQTVLGPFEVNLYDESTPLTVANFLEYVGALDYDNVVIHRTVADFVVQGGGFTYQGTTTLADVPNRGAVDNEPEFSNVRGTIAMAKLAGDPNSASNQWFINVSDSSTTLDVQNGGFTVFGEVTANGMDVIDAIGALPVFDFGGVFSELPLRNFTSQDVTDEVEVTDQHLVVVTAIVIIDAAVDTAAGLSPPANTLIDQTSTPSPPADSGGGGGSTGLLLVLLLGLLSAIRPRRASAF